MGGHPRKLFPDLTHLWIMVMVALLRLDEASGRTGLSSRELRAFLQGGHPGLRDDAFLLLLEHGIIAQNGNEMVSLTDWGRIFLDRYGPRAVEPLLALDQEEVARVV